MRHGKRGRRLGRSSSHRRAMYRNMTAALFVHEKIHTTDAKAKELRRIAERLITKAAKVSDFALKEKSALSKDESRKLLHVRRVISKFVPRFWDDNGSTVDVHHRLLHEIGPRFAARNGGYTRITKIGPRSGDNASLSQIELVEKATDTSDKKTSRGSK